MMLTNPEVKFATFSKCLEVLCDEGLTPYIAVDMTNPNYTGPMVSDDESGIVILNISVTACRNFVMDSTGLSFDYKMGGTRSPAYIPMEAIGSIFAQEDPSNMQPFLVKKDVDKVVESVKVDHNKTAELRQTAPTKPAGSAKPVRKGFTPRLIKGGLS